MSLPAQHRLPSLRLEVSPLGRFTLYVADSGVDLSADMVLQLEMSESGWGPSIDSEVVLSLVDAQGQITTLFTWREHDVLDDHILAPLIEALRQAAHVVRCPLHVEDHSRQAP